MKKEFKKSDLRTGMHLVYRNGEVAVVLLNTMPQGDTTVLLNSTARHFADLGLLHDFFELYHWDDDLMCNSPIGSRNDIMVVKDMNGLVLWKRKEEKTICELDGVEYSESTLRSIIKKATVNVKCTQCIIYKMLTLKKALCLANTLF